MNNLPSAGVNGCGRFGLHLLQYWVDNFANAKFTINYVNDDFLDLQKIKEIIEEDKYLKLRNYTEFTDKALVVSLPSGVNHHIEYTNQSIESIPWLGKPGIFLECSGKYTQKKDWGRELVDNTQQIIISASSWTADQILVYGYNHQQHLDSSVVSYGSCTVNAYIPLAEVLNTKYGITDSDVNIIHNVPAYQLKSFDSLKRRTCTLESVAPYLLPFLNSSNFKVNYTLVPYDGVSIIDYRFRLKNPVSREKFISFLEESINHGPLKNLYGISSVDNGPKEHKFSSNSAVLIKGSIEVKENNLYIQAYFDNENSVNRFFDLTNYLIKARTL